MNLLTSGQRSTAQIKKILEERYKEISSTFIDAVMAWADNIPYVLKGDGTAIIDRSS